MDFQIDTYGKETLSSLVNDNNDLAILIRCMVAYERINLSSANIVNAVTTKVTRDGFKMLRLKAIVRDGGSVIVARAHGDIIGYALLTKRKTEYNLNNIYVMPNYRSETVGDKLMKQVDVLADGKPITLDVLCLEQSVDYFKRRGYISQKIVMRKG